jgi:hypothetical protein
MVICWPQRRALGLGTTMSAAEQADWVRRIARLFRRESGRRSNW